jgi:hypothetical protein
MAMKRMGRAKSDSAARRASSTRSGGPAAQTIRVTIDLSLSFHERLTNLQSVTGVGTKADVIRNAVLLLDFVVKNAGEGYELQVARGQERRTVVMPGIVPAA